MMVNLPPTSLLTPWVYGIYIVLLSNAYTYNAFIAVFLRKQSGICFLYQRCGFIDHYWKSIIIKNRIDVRENTLRVHNHYHFLIFYMRTHHFNFVFQTYLNKYITNRYFDTRYNISKNTILYLHLSFVGISSIRIQCNI